MLKYLFTAQFEDGSVFNQEEADVSALDPKRSAFYDVLQKIEGGNKLVKFSLSPLGMPNPVLSVDLRDGRFTMNGTDLGVNPMHSDVVGDREIIFFRVHQELVVIPARFVDPTGSDNTKEGNLIISDSMGNPHDMGKTAIVAQKEEYVDAQNMEMDKTIEGGRLARVLYVWPHDSSRLTFYDLGWKGKDSEGKSIEQVIRIQ